MNRKDLTGQRFGRLVALEPTDKRYRSTIIWRCRCDCGNACEVPSAWLRKGLTRSCGCLQDEARRNDVTGQRRGHLTAIRPTDQRRNGATVWEWRCDCGATVLKALGLVGDSASTMCPTCARKLKKEQAAAMRDRQERDEDHNMVLGNLEGLRAGKLFRNNTSGVRGVSWHGPNKMWVARIEVNGKTKTIGYYKTIDEAARARREAVKRKYGEE